MKFFTEPSPYYLLVFVFLLFINRIFLSNFHFMKKGTVPSKVYETLVLALLWAYAFYVIAYQYHGFRT